MSDSLWPYGQNSPWNSPGQNTRMGSLCLLQGIFPTQGLNPGLPHCMWVLYQLSHKASPRMLEWVAYPFSSGSSWARSWTGVPCIEGRFFTNWAIREAQKPGLVWVNIAFNINWPPDIKNYIAFSYGQNVKFTTFRYSILLKTQHPWAVSSFVMVW